MPDRVADVVEGFGKILPDKWIEGVRPEQMLICLNDPLVYGPVPLRIVRQALHQGGFQMACRHSKWGFSAMESSNRNSARSRYSGFFVFMNSSR